jgi:hypothetical protein
MLHARSLAEARLFMELDPCSSCRQTGFAEPSRIVERGDQLAVAVRGYCPACGADRAYEIMLGEERVPPHAFGNATPSTLIDAGGWMALANERSARVPATLTGLDAAARERARADLALAIAAIGEIGKFIPAGAESVPRDGFFTATGRRAMLADPRQFTRLRLDAIAEAWRQLMISYRR